MLSKIKYDYLVLLIAVVWAVFFSFVLQLSPGLSPVGDDGSYIYAAKKLYIEGHFDNSRPMLIAAINGFPLLFGGGEREMILWSNGVNLISWLLTVLLLFKTLSQLVSRRIAFISTVGFIFCIGNLANAFNVLSEPIFILLLTLAVYLLSRYEKSRRPYLLTLAFSVLVFATLVKPLALGFVAILVLLYGTKFRGILFNAYVVLLLFSLSLVVFQLHQMKKEHGDYTISYIGSFTYYNYLGEKAHCIKEQLPFVPGTSKRTLHLSQFSSHEQKKMAAADFKEQLQNNTINLGKAYLFCLHSNSSKASYIVSECSNEKQTSYFDFFYFLLKAVSKIQTIAFTVVGVLLSFYVLARKKVSAFHSAISLIILYIFFISGMSCLQCDRFHIVFFPLVFILGTVFLQKRELKIKP